MKSVKTVGFSLFLFALAMLPTGARGAGPPASDRSALKFGPGDSGLRLGLEITRKDDDGQEVYCVCLILKNVSNESIILVARQPEPVPKNADFADYLKAAVVFNTFPEVPQECASVRVDPDLPLPRQVIGAGKTLVLNWISKERRLKDEYFYSTCGPFPLPGLYTVRAEVTVKTGDGEPIHLFSNPHQVAVGGKTTMPRFTVGRTKSVFLDENIVCVDLGSKHGISTDDIFRVGGGKLPKWHLHVIISNLLGSRCKIVPPPKLKGDVLEAKKKFFLGRSRSVQLVLPNETAQRDRSSSLLRSPPHTTVRTDRVYGG